MRSRILLDAMPRCSIEAPALRRIARDHETACYAIAEGRI